MEATKRKLSVVIGTYHCSVAQFDFDLEIGTCKRKWVDDSSTRSISSIKFNGFFCVFGGNDELVRIVNVASNKNVGALHEHQGSITHLETFQNTHLFSSSDDGKLYIWEIGGGHKSRIKGKRNMSKSWECLCCMFHNRNSHNRNDVSSNESFNSKILSFSIHPSGRLMISVDNKHKMKIWDLIRAKCIVTVEMPKPAIEIVWSPNGYNYAVVRENKVLIYSNNGNLYKVIKPVSTLIDHEYYDRYEGTIVSFVYITHDMIGIADMSARIVVYDIDTKAALFRLDGYQQIESEIDGNGSEDNENSKPKIRSLKVCGLNDNLYLVSADNRGRICVWNIHECLNRVIAIGDINEESDYDYSIDDNNLFTFPALMQVDTDTHITCMDVGIVGRLNLHGYKWKKPKTAHGPIAQNMTMDVDSIKITEENDNLDSDNEEAMKQTKNKKKRKKKRKKKPKIDLSRFD